MRGIKENKSITFVISIVLLTALIVVVVLGQKEQKKLSLQLTVQQSTIDKSKINEEKPKDNNTNNTDGAVQAAAVNNYKYIGVNALGNYDNTRWKNKIWYTIGDGMSAANNYQAKVKNMTGMSKVINDAKSNRVMKDLTSNLTAEKLQEADLITVFTGTNDYAFNTPLGTINDNETIETFYGHVKKVINGILKLKPDANIVFITPLKRGAYMNEPLYPNPNNAGVKLEDYVQGIKEVCKSYNILVLDAFNTSGITENNIRQYTIDNLSLNEKGYQKISQVISNYIKTIK